MRVLLDLASLTFDDHIDYEQATDGGSIHAAVAALAKHRSTPLEQKALVWIFTRHIDPTFTFDDAGGLPVMSIEWEIPTRADDEGEG